MPSVNINGAALEYVERGSGAPLVLVHGSGGDRRTWEGQQDALAERFRTVAYSRRYHWPNRPIPEGVDYGMQEQVEDLKKLLVALDASPAHLVGHSYGGVLCLLCAMQEPSLVRSLALAEPPALTLFVSSRPRPLELLRLMATRPRTAAAIVRFGAAGVAPASRALRRGDTELGVRLFGEAVLGRAGYERMSEERKAQVGDNLSNAKAEILGSGFAPLDPARVAAIRAPVLLLTGDRSIDLFHCLVDRLRELLPHARHVSIEGASHNVHEDNPAAFNRAVMSFLAEQGGDAA